jgi:hypothetical protein
MIAGLCVMLAAACVRADDKDGEWATTVHARAVDKKDQTVKPYIRVEGQIRVLTGAVASLDDCKKDRTWVVKGKLSADGKTIEVKEMKERTEWTGDVKVVTEKDKTQVAMLNFKDGHALALKGKVAPLDGFKKNEEWVVTARLSDTLNALEVTEMKKLPKAEKKK